MTNIKDVKRTIADKLKLSGMSLNELARRSNVDSGNLAGWFSGEDDRLSTKSIRSVLEVLGGNLKFKIRWN
jgi:transcriptional regulator with XRE-family HTH domain